MAQNSTYLCPCISIYSHLCAGAWAWYLGLVVLSWLTLALIMVNAVLINTSGVHDLQ